MACMLLDSQYRSQTRTGRLAHHYGPGVRLLSDPFAMTLLARFGSQDCRQPDLNGLLARLYQRLLVEAINDEFPRQILPVKTRMSAVHAQGNFEAELLDRSTKVVSVDLARAGTWPSQLCYELLHSWVEPANLRLDHIYINRQTNDADQVVGAHVAGVKIGGSIENSIVLFPDPMGATGSSLLSTLKLYEPFGRAKKYIALHLIVTPEYLRAVSKAPVPIEVYAIRLDRGLSPSRVLNSEPGEFWEEERGLDERQYIVPGAGGIGEVLNNAFV